VNIHPAEPDPDAAALVARLRGHAAGLLADTAAVDLLAGHDIWLRRPEFRRHVRLGPVPATGTPVAFIDWRAALAALTRGQLPCAGSEADVLRIAAALGADAPLHLPHVLGGLDRTNITLVTDAITYANGARDHHGGPRPTDAPGHRHPLTTTRTLR
jgi:hypothetical protein